MKFDTLSSLYYKNRQKKNQLKLDFLQSDSFILSPDIVIQACRKRGGRGGTYPPLFVRSVNPISTRGERAGGHIIPTLYYVPLRIFRPCDGPVICIYSCESYVTSWRYQELEFVNFVNVFFIQIMIKLKNPNKYNQRPLFITLEEKQPTTSFQQTPFIWKSWHSQW